MNLLLIVFISVSCGHFLSDSYDYCLHEPFMRTFFERFLGLLSSWALHADILLRFPPIVVFMSPSCGHLSLEYNNSCLYEPLSLPPQTIYKKADPNYSASFFVQILFRNHSRNNKFLNFLCAFVDLCDFRITHKSFDWIVLCIAIATEYLNSFRCDLHGCISGK